MSNDEERNHQGDLPDDIPVNELSSVIQYDDIIQDSAYLGTYPINIILEGMEKQFEDYINIEDQTNYVDIFYNQLHLSYNTINDDDGEEHPIELKESLNRIYNEFINKISNLFSDRLLISIIPIEEDNINDPDLEFIIRRLYEFFILDAKNNFKVVIATDIIKKLDPNKDNYLDQIQNLLEEYNPLILSITPVDFIKYRGDQEICNLFENGSFNGNFLRKYSPKLYKNDEFRNEIINYITMVHHFKNVNKGEINNG